MIPFTNEICWYPCLISNSLRSPARRALRSCFLPRRELPKCYPPLATLLSLGTTIEFLVPKTLLSWRRTSMILLMEEIPFPTTWDVWNPVNNGRNYQPQLVSLPDFWTIKSISSDKNSTRQWVRKKWWRSSAVEVQVVFDPEKSLGSDSGRTLGVVVLTPLKLESTPSTKSPKSTKKMVIFIIGFSKNKLETDFRYCTASRCFKTCLNSNCKSFYQSDIWRLKRHIFGTLLDLHSFLFDHVFVKLVLT